jgi:hypothetical protein
MVHTGTAIVNPIHTSNAKKEGKSVFSIPQIL